MSDFLTEFALVGVKVELSSLNVSLDEYPIDWRNRNDPTLIHQNFESVDQTL